MPLNFFLVYNMGPCVGLRRKGDHLQWVSLGGLALRLMLTSAEP